jgi:methionine aminotransferase
LTGLRVGYVVGNMEFISAFTLFNQHISTCTNSLSNAILERITKSCFNNHIAILKDVYCQRYELLKDKLKDTELGLIESKGTFYALIDFSAFFNTGEVAVNFLRDELNTLTTSGSHYGKTFEKYVRICLSVDENCLSEFVNRLTNKLLK